MINKEIGIPYYLQLASLIEEKIKSRLWSEGEKIPSEIEMSRMCHLNRHTVRQAVDYLCVRGALLKVKGRGTFVAKSTVDFLEYKLSPENRFTDNVRQAGKRPDNRMLFCEQTPAPGHASRALMMAPGEPVFHFRILRKVDGKPFLLSDNYSPVKLLPDLDQQLSSAASLFEVYHKHYQMQPRRRKSTFKAGFPREDEARLLQINPGTPVLRVDNTLVASGLLLQYTQACYRGDLAVLSIEWEEDYPPAPG